MCHFFTIEEIYQNHIEVSIGKKKKTNPIKRASKKKEPVAVASPPIKKQKTVNFDELMSYLLNHAHN